MAFYTKQDSSAIQYRLNPDAHRPRVSRGGHKGSARILPLHPPREEQTKHETKPRQNRGKYTFFNGRVFVLLIAFVFVVFYCLLSGRNYPRDFHRNHSHLSRCHRCIAHSLSYRHSRSKSTSIRRTLKLNFGLYNLLFIAQ